MIKFRRDYKSDGNVQSKTTMGREISYIVSQPVIHAVMVRQQKFPRHDDIKCNLFSLCYHFNLLKALHTDRSSSSKQAMLKQTQEENNHA